MNILISGSRGLLGSEIVKFLEKTNNKVFKIDIKKKLKNEINYFNCNVLDEKKIKNTIKKITSKDDIDVLINNAAYNPKSNSKKYKFSSYSLKKWKKNLNIDLIGSFLLSKHVCKHFETKKKGLIINISSIYGMRAPDQSIYEIKNKKTKEIFGVKPLEYTVAKAGLIGFTKSLASYYAGTKIKVISLSLGGIKTNDMKKNFIKKYSAKTISKRMANISEYSEFINFLCSNKIEYISGSNFVLDGGASNII